MDPRDRPDLSRADHRFCRRLARQASKQISTAGDLFVAPTKRYDDQLKADMLEVHICEAPYEVKGGCHDGRRFSYGLAFDADHVRSIFDVPCRTIVTCVFQPHEQCNCTMTVPYVSFEGTVAGKLATVYLYMMPFPIAVPVAITAYESLPSDLPKP